jgi:hypothetical protein
MIEGLDVAVQEGNVLLGIIKKHAGELAGNGIEAEDIQVLQAAIADVFAKNKLQTDAVQAVSDLTVLQNKSMEKGLALIRKTQAAAASVYGEGDKQRMKEFHVGVVSVTTVKVMTTELAYMKGVAEKRKIDLAKRGLKDADIAAFDTINAELTDNDASQEAAKKMQKEATAARNDSVGTLNNIMRSMRKAARVAFADKPEMLVEFETITAARSGKKQEPVPAVNAAATASAAK